ncbi:MAG: hypothetical protein Q9190_002706 [Brigantiaea leucoxantha]
MTARSVTARVNRVKALTWYKRYLLGVECQYVLCGCIACSYEPVVMSTQGDSIDISQLKAAALSSQLVQTGDPNAAPSAVGKLQQLNNSVTRRTGDPAHRPYHVRSHFTLSSSPPPRGPGIDLPSDAPRLRLAASQTKPPSTISESARSRMPTQGTPSQGDTQEIPNDWYMEYAINRSKELQAARILSEQAGTTTGDTTLTPHSYLPGQTGHIDLVGVFEEPSLSARPRSCSEPSDDELGDISQSQDVRTELYPESKRFQQPKTPATAGKKRKRPNGITPQSEATPGFPVNPFAGQAIGIDDLMGTSQLFQATQAPSSPMANHLPSDGLSQRPSPKFSEIRRPSTADASSSPAKPLRSGFVRALTEPQTTYVSLKESQAERERRLQGVCVGQTSSDVDELDNEFDSDGSDIRKRQNQRRLELDAQQTFANITARSMPASSSRGGGRGRGRGRGFNAPLMRSPAELNFPVAKVSDTIVLSDDPPVKDMANATEDETEQEEIQSDGSDDEIDELADENKENMGSSGILVPMSTSRAKHRPSKTLEPSPSHRHLRGSRLSNKAPHTHAGEGRLHSSASQGRLEDPASGSPTLAVADSQPTNSKSVPDLMRLRRHSRKEPVSSPNQQAFVPPTQLSQPNHNSASSADGAVIIAHDDKVVASERRHSSRELVNSSNKSPGRYNNIEECTSATAQTPSSSNPRPMISTENAPNHDTDNHGPNSMVLPGLERPVISASNDAAEAGTMQTSSRPDVCAHGHNASSCPSNATTSVYAQTTGNLSVVNTSKQSTNFGTAQTHFQSATEDSTGPIRRQLEQNITSPVRRSPRIRTMAEIAAQPSPSDTVGSVDVDINLMTSEDVEFHELINGGSSSVPLGEKRRKGPAGRAVQILAQQASSSPVSELSLHSSARTPEGREQQRLSVSPQAARPKGSYSTFQQRLKPKATTAITNSASRKEENSSQKHNSSFRRPKGNITNLRIQATSSTNDPEPQDLVINKRIAHEAPHTQQASKRTVDPPLDVVKRSPAPNRVFAHFNGRYPGFYPATCLKIFEGIDTKYRVRFDDGNFDLIRGYGIKRFELRIGDVVKIDGEGLRPNNYIVENLLDGRGPDILPHLLALSNQRQGPLPADTKIPLTDIFGHKYVQVSQKQRHSMLGGSKALASVMVPIGKVYLTQTMWTNLRDRTYTHVSTQTDATGLPTPSERPSTPVTPSTRSRRMKFQAVAISRSTISTTSNIAGLFSNMVFALTAISNDERRNNIADLIETNNGQILDSSFEGLFHIPSLLLSACEKQGTDSSNDDNLFRLTEASSKIGFTCVLADTHSRSAKYIQALALGIPCLSSRWILDCISRGSIIPWEPYLLASGESAFLSGAVRSRVLDHIYPAETAQLNTIVEKRRRIMDGGSVLLIMTKSEEQIMQNHPLLTYALGAERVARVASVEAAVNAVKEMRAKGEDWDWVYSHKREKEVEKVLFDGMETSRRLKRNRGMMAGMDARGRGKTKVVGHDFVIQSLILGRLVDAE